MAGLQFLKGKKYQPGDLFLGIGATMNNGEVEAEEKGITTERHAITIAGAGSGKGACVIIPNLRRWTENALVIDPKGEAAEATAEAREKMGQAVHVIDPFGVADVPERFKASLNPLDEVDTNDLTAREDINCIADGLVLRDNPQAGFWDGGGLSIISGLTAFIADMAPADARTLPEIRSLLLALGKDPENIIAQLADNHACGNLPAATAQKLMTGGNEVKSFMQVADANTSWLDSPAIQSVLEKSTFRISDLKTKSCTVYLVLPAHLLGEHGRFLRLFVRVALNAMAKGGTKGGRRCLFILDEFFSLGYIDEIAKAAGLMRGYGVQLWPILQDLGQLLKLYGTEGAETFFGNADLHQFFGNSDQLTLQHISQRLGVIDSSEIGPAPNAPVGSTGAGWQVMQGVSQGSQHGGVRAMGGLFFGGLSAISGTAAAHDQANYQSLMNQHQQAMSRVGRPRYQPDEIAQIVQKTDGKVAKAMICFVPGGSALQLQPKPYFDEDKIAAANDLILEIEKQKKKIDDGYSAHLNALDDEDIPFNFNMVRSVIAVAAVLAVPSYFVAPPELVVLLTLSGTGIFAVFAHRYNQAVFQKFREKELTQYRKIKKEDYDRFDQLLARAQELQDKNDY